MILLDDRTFDTIDGHTEHGVWSDEAGGFIESSIYVQQEADEALLRCVAMDEDPDDLHVLPFCEDHRDAEQPRNSCEWCFYDDGED